MSAAIYPGTFDPITYGHIDIAKRAANIFSKVYAVIAVNTTKKPFFTVDERVEMARSALSGINKIEVVTCNGLIADCLDKYHALTIIRGMRALSDFEYEFQMAFTNRKINPDADTMFLMPNEKFIYLNSTMVKEIARLGGDIGQFVPDCVKKVMKRRLKADREKIRLGKK